jgi:hypothetical protein
MASSSGVTKKLQTEPRWPAVLAVVAIGLVYLALPEHLTLGPNWTLLVLIFLLLIPSLITHRTGNIRLASILGLALSSFTTLALLWALGNLIAGLPKHRESPAILLQAAAALWISNILVFASWYWRLDAGGPHARDLREAHTEGAFLFPQMVMPPGKKAGVRGWKPGFVDYLFLAFNTSTAFSPTDVPVLSRWAKLLMMVQSIISLGTVVILGARAINIL